MATITHRVGLQLNLTAAEVDANFDALNADINPSIAFTYDNSTPKRLTSYSRNGVNYTVAYPDATHIVITGGGFAKTLTFDVLGNCLSRTQVPA